MSGNNRQQDRRPDPIGSWSIKAGLNDILQQSCRLMARKGYHGTSMRDLSQETGRSLAGLYHYFRNKEDLLFLINFHGFTTLNETRRKMVDTFTTSHEKLYALVFSHVSYYVSHMNEMRVMMWGTQELTLEKARIIQKMKDEYATAAAEVVGEVFRATTGQDIDDRRLQRETYLLFGMMNWTYSWFSPDEHGTAQELVEDVYQTFIYGLAGEAVSRSDFERMHATVSEWFGANGAASMW
jgi:AcrR family transcriptional regulator